MDTEPIRVLHVLGRLNMGGAETRIMDLYRHMDRSRVQFDFLVHYQRTKEDRAAGVGTDSASLYKARAQEDYDALALSLGAHIYVLPRFTGTNLPEYRKACRAFFAQHHEWSVIEGHMTSMASVYLPIAKEEAAKAAGASSGRRREARNGADSSGRDSGAGPGEKRSGAEPAAGTGVPVTIAHARSAGVDAGVRGLATRFFRHSLPKKCDIMMSCSGPASVSVFGRKAARSGRVRIVPNALDLDTFHYDEDVRERTRAEYGIRGDTLVIGHVGRFDPVKNQAFLARVGAALRTESSQRDGTCPAKPFVFLFVGQGEQMEPVREAFAAEGLEENVLFAGLLAREQTAAAYQAFDVFTLPSLYEGLPGTVIEAQAAGLPCVIADTITEEVALTDLVCRVPLDDPAEWARVIKERAPERERLPGPPQDDGKSGAAQPKTPGCSCGRPEAGAAAAQERAQISADAMRCLAEAGYEIRSAAQRMQELYLQLAGDPGREDSC